MCIIQQTKVRCADLAENRQSFPEDDESESPLPLVAPLFCFGRRACNKLADSFPDPLEKPSSTQSLL